MYICVYLLDSNSENEFIRKKVKKKKLLLYYKINRQNVLTHVIYNHLMSKLHFDIEKKIPLIETRTSNVILMSHDTLPLGFDKIFRKTDS